MSVLTLIRSRKESKAQRLQRILQQWKEHVAESYNVVNTGQEFIEPYVLQTRKMNFDVNLLIATVTAKVWYDKILCWPDLEHMSQLQLIQPGDVVFDLGAHNGFYSVMFAKMTGPKGRVYAFEPFPTNAAVTRFNAMLNNAKIDVFEVGLSNAAGKVVASPATETVVHDESAASLTITLDTIDNYAHLRPDFLKIDIEGAEIDALAGAKKVLARRPNMYIEVHTPFFTRYNHKVEDLFDVLPMDGYTCWIGYPGKEFGPYNREFPITEHCCLYLFKDEPVRRIYG